MEMLALSSLILYMNTSIFKRVMDDIWQSHFEVEKKLKSVIVNVRFQLITLKSQFSFTVNMYTIPNNSLPP